MDDRKFPRITGKTGVSVGLIVVLTPTFMLVLLFNFHDSIIDLSGAYSAVCLQSRDAQPELWQQVLYLVLPKLSGHCTSITLFGFLEIIPREHWDIIIVFDLSVFVLPFLTSIYFVFTYKDFRHVMIQAYLRNASTIKYYRTRLVVLTIVGSCTCLWFVLFAPIEIPAPTGFFFVTDLMADYGFGVFFCSLCGALLPFCLTFALANMPVLTDREGRLERRVRQETERN